MTSDEHNRYLHTMHSILSQHFLVLILEMDVLPVGHISFSVQLPESLTLFLRDSLVTDDLCPSSVLPDV